MIVVYMIYVLKISNQIKIFNRIKSKSDKTEEVEVEVRPNQYLKEVEIVGFLGQPEEAEVVAYLVKSAINLEKITLHTDVWLLEIIYTKEFSQSTKQMAQSLACQLMENRPRAELLLL
ncbi:hypothetical protein V6N12_023691 [Hibiscus sabdariffa]|uniref:FBD domain-containing protein n=1 Tax=Hibiscus sabdariffa TaxID=183260 RepID=A0ABR2FZ22_9ROSI